MSIYRFRTAEALLDKFNELQNQEIYFAPPEELNDPMEGFKDIYWKGDKIIWKNLIINYIKCVEHIYALSLILANDKTINNNDIKISSRHYFQRSNDRIGLINQIIEQFFLDETIYTLPQSLENRCNPIKRNELLAYLYYLLPKILNSISEIYSKNNRANRMQYNDLTNLGPMLKGRFKNIADLTNQMDVDHSHRQQFIEIFFTQANILMKRLLSSIFLKSHESPAISNSLFLNVELPERYLTKLEELMYPDWYSASFLSDDTNPSVWGHYGDGHKGVCLIFKTKESGEHFEMELEFTQEDENEYRNTIESLQFRKVLYPKTHIEIGFFQSLGRISGGELYHDWFSDNNGNVSSCFKSMREDEEQWRNNYWDNFYNSLVTKLPEWEYEKEYRLIVHGDLTDYSSPKSRKAKYDFNDLEGIIFGIKTTTDVKIKIMKIIQSKCKKHKRKDFVFYQAYYSKEAKCIKKFKLDMSNLDSSPSREFSAA